MGTRIRLAVIGTLLALPAAHAQHDHGAMHQHQAAASVPAKDTRQAVRFPKSLREHTLANMRDHLLALQEIQQALAAEQYDRAGDIAEQRLGMSSLKLHGAHDVAPYMPKGMQVIGTEMHRSASRFAVSAKDAAATGDVKAPLAALGEVTAQCVACHSGYRVR